MKNNSEQQEKRLKCNRSPNHIFVSVQQFTQQLNFNRLWQQFPIIFIGLTPRAGITAIELSV